jgi:hypothetical protein
MRRGSPAVWASTVEIFVQDEGAVQSAFMSILSSQKKDNGVGIINK